jgi:hypothetical protein
MNKEERNESNGTGQLTVASEEVGNGKAEMPETEVEKETKVDETTDRTGKDKKEANKKSFNRREEEKKTT